MEEAITRKGVSVQPSLLKELALSLRRIGADLKRCRAGDMALHGLASLNGTSEALTITVLELQDAAKALAKDAHAFAKSVGDLASTVTASTPPDVEERKR
jgi:hypothetical protein